MHRTLSVVALLAAALVAGCSKPNNPPAPAPTFKPQVNTPAVQGGAPESSDLTNSDQAGAESSLTSSDEAASQEIPAEEKAEMTDDAAAAEAATPATAGDEQAVDGGAETENAPAASPKSKGSSGKLLRSLGNSLGRALSKSAGNSGNGGAKARPAPKLEDDPFPNGEPSDTKPKD